MPTRPPKPNDRRPDGHHAPGALRRRSSSRPGFSLVELVVVLSVALLLTALMLPALAQVRENAFRVICASNQRQLGIGMFMYANDHEDELPRSSFLEGQEEDPQELMVAYRSEGVLNPDDGGTHFIEWDGLGVLFSEGYCSDPGCFYCPSHKGDHTIDRYQPMWQVESPAGRIYTNYHYSGHRDWQTDSLRSLDDGEQLILLTDGLRTRQDFSHRVGMNLLAGDGSVRWKDDTIGIYESLPSMALAASDPTADGFDALWSRIEGLATGRH
ncbi:MAG: prepilin-type N-terminal cleavage/methylation domain-containing protein [Planctomycetota bacterium]|jgi:prepilin-type N-terminal cleavage/methylation domain-containing protein